MTQLFSITPEEKNKYIQLITASLIDDDNIAFAYLFGSFVHSPMYRDIDVGVYLKKPETDVLRYYSVMSDKLALKCNLSYEVFDIKILNNAPLMFLNNVFASGKELFTHDEALLTDLIEKSSIEAISNEYILKQSLKELLDD